MGCVWALAAAVLAPTCLTLPLISPAVFLLNAEEMRQSLMALNAKMDAQAAARSSKL